MYGLGVEHQEIHLQPLTTCELEEIWGGYQRKVKKAPQLIPLKYKVYPSVYPKE